MIVELVAQVATILPNPTPVRPPGVEGVDTFFNYLTWGVIIAGLGGFLLSVCTLAFAAFTGRVLKSVGGLVIAIVVCVLATSASLILRVFI